MLSTTAPNLVVIFATFLNSNTVQEHSSMTILKLIVQKWKSCAKFAIENTLEMSSTDISASKTSTLTVWKTWMTRWLRTWWTDWSFTRDKRKAWVYVLSSSVLKNIEILATRTTWAWLYKIQKLLLANALNVSRLLLDSKIAIPVFIARKLTAHSVLATWSITISRRWSRFLQQSTIIGESDFV